MKTIIKLIIFSICICSTAVQAKENFFKEAKELYEKKKYEDSKFLFQRNIVFNPKDAKSYLYLAKIYKVEEDDRKEEKNLNVTLLLEPDNEEAMYMLIDMELKRSNFSKVKKMTKNFKVICSFLCDKTSSIEERLNNFEEKNES